MTKKIVITLLLTVLQFTAYAQQTYQLDVKKSKILWNGPKKMGSHYGYLLFNSGSLNYSAAGEPTDGSFSMNMNTLTGIDHAQAADNQKTNKELRTPGFFDVGKYPVATMQVKKIVPVDNKTTFKVSGDLTIKGITNLIEFTATIKSSANSINVTADLKISRNKWRIDFQPKPQSWDFISAMKDEIVADEIPVTLNLVFLK